MAGFVIFTISSRRSRNDRVADADPAGFSISHSGFPASGRYSAARASVGVAFAARLPGSTDARAAATTQTRIRPPV